MNRIAFGVISFLSLVAIAQEADSPSTGLVKVETSLDHPVIRAGEDLDVMVKLTAGPRGAYISNHFGDFYENCESGFSVDIFTLQGDRASNSMKSCAYDHIFGSEPVANLLKEYVLLNPKRVGAGIQLWPKLQSLQEPTKSAQSISRHKTGFKRLLLCRRFTG